MHPHPTLNPIRSNERAEPGAWESWGAGVASAERVQGASMAAATRWARRGLKAGVLVLLVAVPVMFTHPVAAPCTDQTAAQRAWMYAIAAWVICGGLLIAACAGMATRARLGEHSMQRPVRAVLGVGALAAILWAEPVPLFVLAIAMLVGTALFIFGAAGWCVAAWTQAVCWKPPYTQRQLKRALASLWLEVLLVLPAIFVLAALVDNVYHDCS